MWGPPQAFLNTPNIFGFSTDGWLLGSRAALVKLFFCGTVGVAKATRSTLISVRPMIYHGFGHSHRFLFVP